jgi:hypothetical protein
MCSMDKFWAQVLCICDNVHCTRGRSACSWTSPHVGLYDYTVVIYHCICIYSYILLVDIGCTKKITSCYIVVYIVVN